MSITLRQLEIFIAVAETAQVTKASKKLFVTQSAVSMALAELENQLGGSLFDRHGRSLLLNARGRFLLPLSKDITGQVSNIETIMSERNDKLDGSIEIVASTTLGNYILPYLIGAFKKVHPNVHVNLLVYNTRYAEKLVFDNVIVPKENLFPEVKGLRGPLSCLNSARYGIAWGAIGAAMDCYDAALRYALERKQFGKPIAGFQLQQKKLAEALTEITKAQLLIWRLGQLRDQGKATAAQISMAKRNNVAMALNIARETRQILGAMGITSDFPMMRHMMNLESVITYEGTHDVHLLITGAEVTGIPAFY